MEVFKSPQCGCCGKWIKHLQQNGFQVNTHEVNGVPAARNGPAIASALAREGRRFGAVLLDPPQSGMNVGEWAKQQACRNRVFSTEVPQVDGFDSLLVSRMDKQAGRRSEREGQRVATGVEALQEVMRLGGDYWARVRDVARKHGLSSPEDDNALAASSAYPRKLPQEFQAIKAVAVLKRMQDAGLTVS